MTHAQDYKLRTLMYAGDNGFYGIVMQGKATLPELRKVLTKNAVFPDTRLELWLIDELELDLSSSELALLAELVKSNTYQPQKTAIVTGNDLLFGLSRVFSGYRESEHTQVNVFRDVESAVEWLEVSDVAPDFSNIRDAEWKYYGPNAIPNVSQ